MSRETSLEHRGGVGTRLRDLWRSGVTLRSAMRGPVPPDFSMRPQSLHFGAAERADAMLQGNFDMVGKAAKAERGDPWRIDAPSIGWFEALHGFEWLADFRSADGSMAREAARKVTDAWIHRFGGGGGPSWDPAVTGARVVNWCLSADLLTAEAEPVYRSEVLRLLAVQARFLRQTAEAEEAPMRRLSGALGAAYASLCLQGEAETLNADIARVTKLAEAALNADGGPKTRAPADLYTVLDDLVQLRKVLEDSGREAESAKFTPLIERITPIVRLLRHGDGSLAGFHGGAPPEPERITRTLIEARHTLPPTDEAAQSGFLRLSEGGTAIIADAGNTPQGSEKGHIAPLSFEMSSGRYPLIVNCGSAAHLGVEWETPCRGPAAHSTLTVAERAPGSFQGKDGTHARRIAKGAKVVDRRTDRDMSGIWALAAHDGYAEHYGLVHYRRLFLSSNGTDFRGEDTLTLTSGGAATLQKSRAERKTPDGPAFALRFHVHPEVIISLKDGRALLTLESGERWQFMQSGGMLGLEDSVFIPRYSAPRPTKQIVVESALRDTEGQVRWALKRIEPEE